VTNEAHDSPAARAKGILQALTMVVIDRRALIRECLVRCFRSVADNCVVLDFPTVDDWQQASTRNVAAVVILCTQGRHDAETEHDLCQLAQGDASVPVVVLSDAENAEHILAALEWGARGYIPTSMSFDVAVKAMRLVEAGGMFVPASTIYSSRRDPVPHVATGQFTARQSAVVEALCQGKANKQIAYELNMCEGTVKVHVRNIMKKLKARNRTEVAVLMSGDKH
jgi:DNA-binding NarL/FixJ family response regulator